MFDIFTPDVINRLYDGFIITLQISFVSMFFSLIFGIFLGILMSLKNMFIYYLCRFALEFIRIMPIIVWLFVFYFGFSDYFHLSSFGASVLVFSIWGSFEIMDLVRASILSIPKHQFQSGISLGLNTAQVYFYVILPQALKRFIPACINLFTRMVKTTPVTSLIGVIELIKIGQQVIEVNIDNIYAPFLIYGLIFLLYFIICYPISIYSKILEKKWS